ncbi:hypothetical protein [Schlesneria sp. DSM 10557]|uniref:hypothetical protein n=2 Tax=unclassified Schlesneria TaxID=2762017 RepID=UPI00359F9F3E
MLLAQKPASVNWESVALDPSGQHALWVWFRPPAIPYGLMLVVPASLFSDAQLLGQLTLRQLVLLAGIDQERILGWIVNGISYDGAGGTSPLLDHPLPAPPAGVNLEVSVWIEPIPTAASVPSAPVYQPHYSAQGTTSDFDQRLLAAIESTWQTIQQMEMRISSIRKDLASNLSRLNSLNRDLNSDERRICDSKDIQAWTDARRWLRDSIATLSRSVKEIDVGTTSGAGQRYKFEEIYRKYAVPRQPFPGLSQTVHEFESYQKTVQNVLTSAQANISRAGRDAEQRANAVLTRISAKMRSHRR